MCMRLCVSGCLLLLVCVHRGVIFSYAGLIFRPIQRRAEMRGKAGNGIHHTFRGSAAFPLGVKWGEKKLPHGNTICRTKTMNDNYIHTRTTSGNGKKKLKRGCRRRGGWRIGSNI